MEVCARARAYAVALEGVCVRARARSRAQRAPACSSQDLMRAIGHRQRSRACSRASTAARRRSACSGGASYRARRSSCSSASSRGAGAADVSVKRAAEQLQKSRRMQASVLRSSQEFRWLIMVHFVWTFRRPRCQGRDGHCYRTV